MTSTSTETIALFRQGGFWEALEQYAAERTQKLQERAIGAASWDDVLKAQGARDELKLLRQLAVEVRPKADA